MQPAMEEMLGPRHDDERQVLRPRITRLPRGTGGTSKLSTAVPTRTSLSGFTRAASLACIAAPKEKPARTILWPAICATTAARSSTSPRPSS